jgi:hypothetical protein
MKKLSRILADMILISAVLLMFTSCKYMKMDPPPDVDKSGVANDNSCWMATASNMLAGAGYGTGANVQARADEIYSEMVTQYGVNNGGWADAALSWWLSSTNNTWSASNPYTIVTVYGNKTRIPWTNANGAQFIGNELRRCQFVGLSISWPVVGAAAGTGGHAITAWGDNMGSGTLTTNPASVSVTDSDADTGGDVQNYDYDAYTSPNPSGPNHGNGWYCDYSNNHPFIKHIITLCPVDDPADNELTQRVVGSYRIHQSREEESATDLHYRVRTDADILTYKTTIDWTDKVSPAIVESNPRRSLTVDWDLTEFPVSYCTWVTITTEFILPLYNAIFYDDVHFTYPDNFDPTIKEIHKKPDLYWWLKTPVLMRADQILNVTGGYLVAGFNVINPNLSSNQRLVGEYRLIHEYNYNQDPEVHEFLLAGSEGYLVEKISFGHSYGYLSKAELWEFEKWMTVVEDSVYYLGEEAFVIPIDWEGKLPYPEGEIIPENIKRELQKNE